MTAQGPLAGLRVVEMAGIGPTPFCGMLLADLGADIVRIDRENPSSPVAGAVRGSEFDFLRRGRRSVTLDLKKAADVDACLDLFAGADAVIEGYRPGVMERLGLGPDVALGRNPALVYGRMTGWGQTGPLASAAGHDINYIALSGALHAIGDRDRPTPPLNLVGDFGGGALYLAFGVLAALRHAHVSGEGQVVDCAMSDGSASLMTAVYGMHASGAWSDQRRANPLDGGAPFYDTYRCLDGGWIAVGSLEPQFYLKLLEACGIDLAEFGSRQWDRDAWPPLRAALEAAFSSRTRADWVQDLEGVDVCFAPVLSLSEASRHPHNVARNVFVDVGGVRQPAPAPRFSATPGQIQSHETCTAGDISRDWKSRAREWL